MTLLILTSLFKANLIGRRRATKTEIATAKRQYKRHQRVYYATNILRLSKTE